MSISNNHQTGSTPTNKQDTQPSKDGIFGNEFGGYYVGETLMPLILRVKDTFEECQKDTSFWKELKWYQEHYIGKPTPLYRATATENKFNKGQVFFKRDELNHTGSHKINNCLGQALLAKRMGKNLIIAETGAGQHGVATASVCALFKLKCVIFMGAKDAERQQMNVFRMKLLGAEVVSVTSGSRSLKDALNEAMRYWAENAEHAYYLIGTAAGPHPYPYIVREFQSIIGKEVQQQLKTHYNIDNPTHLIACIGGGSNAIGLFHNYIENPSVKLIGVESAGKGLETNKHAATLSKGSRGVLHGNLTYLLQDEAGNINQTHSIAAGLDYPGVGPEHAHLKEINRAEYVSVTDNEAMEAMKTCSRLEGIIPAIEPSHALAYAYKLLPSTTKDDIIVINICGRGDKDITIAMDFFGDNISN